MSFPERVLPGLRCDRQIKTQARNFSERSGSGRVVRTIVASVWLGAGRKSGRALMTADQFLSTNGSVEIGVVRGLWLATVPSGARNPFPRQLFQGREASTAPELRFAALRFRSA